MSAEEMIASGDLELPPVPQPVGSYVPCVRTGNLIYLSGALPLGPDGLAFKGKIGREFTAEEGNKAAQLCAKNLLAVLRDALGNLDRVGRVVSLTGFVNAVEDFEDAAAVMNGASDLMKEVFGERGLHSRAAVSVSGLPKGAAVEVAGIFELG